MRAFGSSGNFLVFDDRERGPSGTLHYQFEAISRMPEYYQDTTHMLLDAVIVKNQVTGAIERVVKQPPAAVSLVKAEATPRREQAGGARR